MKKIAIIGLGYVGLPLAHAFSFKYDAIILAVAHNEFKNLNLTKKDNQVIYDIKGVLDKNLVDGRL